jgi:4-amino-4-deoxy-L-arabinose transferase-like glycosyltransferase
MSAPPKVLAISKVAFVLVTIIALVLRLAGIGFGLPVHLHGDECILVERALAFASSGDFNPHYFIYPSFFIYLLFALNSLLSSLIGGILGYPLAGQDYYLIGRIVSASLGVATVVCVYVITRRVANKRAALLAALTLSIVNLHVQHSHYATTDVAMTFWVTLALLGLMAWLQGDNRAPYFTGVSIGLAAATKYNAAVLLSSVFVAGLLQEWQTLRIKPTCQRRRLFIGLTAIALIVAGLIGFGGIVFMDKILATMRGWTEDGVLEREYVGFAHQFSYLALFAAFVLATLLTLALSKRNLVNPLVNFLTSKSLVVPLSLAVLTFFVASPYVMLDYKTFLRGFFYNYRFAHLGHAAQHSVGSASYHVLLGAEPRDYFYYLRLLFQDLGVFAPLLIGGGIWALWRVHSRRFLIILLTFIVPYLVIISSWTLKVDRYVLVLWPTFAILSGIGLDALLARFWTLFDSGARYTYCLALITTLIFVSLVYYHPIEHTIKMTKRSFLTPDTRHLAMEWIQAHLPPGTAILREWDTPDIERVTDKYEVLYEVSAFEGHSPEYWSHLGIQVIVLGSRRAYYARNRDVFASVIERYELLETRGRLLQVFEPRRDLVGPPIRIYSLP